MPTPPILPQLFWDPDTSTTFHDPDLGHERLKENRIKSLEDRIEQLEKDMCDLLLLIGK